VSATRQATRGARSASRKVQETPERLRRTGADVREKAGDVAPSAGAEELFQDTRGDRDSEFAREPQTIRDELAAIVRETAIEVLAPVARQATKYAAKYAIQRGPQLARQTLMPRLKETLDLVQDAGGPGAFAKDALGGGSSVLSRLGVGDEEEDGQGAWESAKTPLEEHVDVAIGLQDAYEYFQQFAQHISFMSEHEQVEEVPNERIVWESSDGLEAICVITFHELSERLTRVMVTYESHPHGLQKATSALRLPRRVLRADLMRFKSLVEVHPDEADELYEEPEEVEGRDDELEADDEPEREEEEPEEEEDEAVPAKARRRPQASGAQRRQSKESPANASSQPRKRTVRGGPQQSSGSGSGTGRQAKPASKAGQSRARAKG
jgi:hypothetical protein